MSVIAGKVYGDKIVIAADSIICRGWMKQTGYAKLHEVNGMIFGSAGLASEGSLFYQFLKTHRPATPTEKDVLELIVEFSEWKKKYTSSEMENSYLLAVDGHLFYIVYMLVHEVQDYEAVGAGEEYAKAALYLGHTPMEAVKVACELCCFVSEPIYEYEMARTSLSETCSSTRKPTI